MIDLTSQARRVPSGPMPVPSRMVLVLIALMLVLTPMAMASPPDSTWLAGFWDDADFDDVVLLVTGAAGAVESHLAAVTTSPVVVVRTINPANTVHARTSVVAAVSSRAPPASF